VEGVADARSYAADQEQGDPVADGAGAEKLRVRILRAGNERAVAIATQGTASNYLQRAPSPSSLSDVVDLILDKGLVIDAYVRVSVIGIELVTIDARIVIASIDSYLRFAEAVNRLDLTQTEAAGLKELREGGKHDSDTKDKSKGMFEGAKEAFTGNGKRK
jgi:hypothetical protein